MDEQVETVDITRPDKQRRATGAPGRKPHWSSGAKTLVGTAASARSRVWFTVGLGILNELYFEDLDQANTRSIRFVVTDGAGFCSDEAWDADHKVTGDAGIPWCSIESTCKRGRYRIVKEIVTDPVHNVVLVQVQFTHLAGPSLRLYLTVDPHLGDVGTGNSAWVGGYKGRTVLIAKRDAVALAVATTAAIKQASCGFIGKSDAWTVLKKRKPLPTHNFARQGNVSMSAELDWQAMQGGRFSIAIGFGKRAPEAAQEATAGVLQDFAQVKSHFIAGWKQEQSRYAVIADLSGHNLDMYRVSTAVLETHQSKRFPGGFVASLSMPWGFDRSDSDIGGYHVLWPRDMVESAMGKLACGDAHTARSSLLYLHCTQEPSGGWTQNMFLDGTPHWKAVQMDGIALPILLADRLRRENALDGYDARPMVYGATRFLLKRGPFTEQDRWESLPGYSPYTMATQVAALLAAADLIEAHGQSAKAAFLRDTADAWHDTIDEFTYVTGTALARAHRVPGYYVRMAPQQRIRRNDMGNLRLTMQNLPAGQKRQLAVDIVSPDCLALVRFGMRSPDDPRILNSIKILDATLKRQTQTGPTWIRSTKDGYGEQKDGRPYHKTGIGRGWPLLTGERGHYEIAAGNRETALELLKTMARQTSACGMIPEQVWESKDIPKHMLFNGKPSGSGMPLAWAHAEYIKLLRSLHANAVWDLPPQTVARYQVRQGTARFQIWSPAQPRVWVAAAKDLRIDLPGPATVRWSAGGQSGALQTQDSGFGVHHATLPIGRLDASSIHVKIDPEPGMTAPGLRRQSFVIRRVLAVGHRSAAFPEDAA